MPIYEYQCGSCSHITEFLERFDTDGTHECEKCGGDEMNRILSVFSASSEGKSITGGGDSCGCSSCSSHNCSSCGS